MRLTSSDFFDEGRIPRVCSCEGEDASRRCSGATRRRRQGASFSSATIPTR